MRLLRSLFVVLLWLLFVALWYRVYGITTVSDLTGAFTYVTGIIIVYGIVITAWILHNIAIFRRKGPRRGVLHLEFAAIHDRLGSYIVAPPNIKQTQSIVVNVSDGRKIFTEGEREPR